MILTVKAKEDFLKWCKQDADFMQTYEDIFLFALIIEWLDSVGLFCVINYNFMDDEWSFSIKCRLTMTYIHRCYNTRKQATKQAIIKANKIYNEINRFKSR